MHTRAEVLHTGSTVGCFVLLDRTRYDGAARLTMLSCTLFSRIQLEEGEAVRRRGGAWQTSRPCQLALGAGLRSTTVRPTNRGLSEDQSDGKRLGVCPYSFCFDFPHPPGVRVIANYKGCRYMPEKKFQAEYVFDPGE